jgi:glutathione synthase/RimK-type ligase-like ATP-grasp enzyme
MVPVALVEVPIIEPGLEPVEAGDPAAFIRMAFEGVELAPLIQERAAALGAGGRSDAARLLELGVLFQLVGEREKALLCQRAALDLERLYRHPAADGTKLRLLAVSTLGDLMSNTPFELMVQGKGVEIIKLYLDTDQPWPSVVPDHDLAIMAVSESDDTRALLEELRGIEGRWPRPMINRASQVLELARDRLHLRLAGAPGIMIPPTVVATRQDLDAAAEADLEGLLPGAGFPLIVRPVGSHAGKGLERIDNAAALRAYLTGAQSERYYISPFVDYAGPDGLFRKYRIACFGGRWFLCHMAVSEHWMVHYLNAGMAERAERRAEEADAMASFDQNFASRHAPALQALQERLGLDYFAVDCAEYTDGSLLIFEADVAMIIHDLDPEAVYPYKKIQMSRVFDAFGEFLHVAARGGPPQTDAIHQSSAA